MRQPYSVPDFGREIRVSLDEIETAFAQITAAITRIKALLSAANDGEPSDAPIPVLRHPIHGRTPDTPTDDPLSI